MSNREVKIVQANEVAKKYEINQTAIDIQRQFLNAGYLTSFTHHFAKRPVGQYATTMTDDHFTVLDPVVHCSKTLVAIYQTSEENIGISIFSPTTANVVNYGVKVDMDETKLIEGLIELFPVEATLFLTETSTDAEVQAQLEFLSHRRPSHPFNPVHKPLTDADIQEAIRGLNMQEGIPLGEGQLLETVGEEQAVVVGQESYPDIATFDEKNEDAELGKIVDAREGQARIRVDVESL